MANLTRLSKFLALVLRHKATEFRIQLDEQGFTDIETVWSLIEQRYPNQYTRADLLQVVRGDRKGKKRYEIANQKIRAMYGHGSVSNISYTPVSPPAILFHGTTPEALSSIRQTGLEPRGRQYVHLTTNLNIAKNIANRRTKDLVILKIKAEEAFNDGIPFYQPEDEHYLVHLIPPKYILFPD